MQFPEALLLDLVILDLEFQLVKLGAVHLREELPLPDIIAYLDEDSADSPALLGLDVVGGISLDGRGVGNLLIDVTKDRLRHLNVSGSVHGRSLLLLRLWGAASAGIQRKKDDRNR